MNRKEIILSHLVTLSTKIKDSVAVTAACQRLGLPQPVQGTADLFSGQATGLLVQFPGWQYPAVVDTLTGSIKYDNYGGRWGEQAQLEKFLQSYAVEKSGVTQCTPCYGLLEANSRFRVVYGRGSRLQVALAA
jgi:hypothetical protein